jgi:multidrug efflux pump subunit AcrB
LERLQRAVATAILRDRAVVGLSSYIGTNNGSSLNNGSMVVNLKPLEQRNESIQQVIARLRTEIAKVEGVRTFFTPLQDLNVGAQATAARYQYTLTGSDPDEVWRWSEAMRRKMQALPEIVELISDAETTGLEAGLTVDRMRAAALGVTPLAIDNILYDAFGQRQITTIYLPFNYSRVVLEIDPTSQTDPSMFRNIYVPGTGNNAVPLSALTTERRGHAAMWIRHSDQFPSVTISFDTRPGVSIRQAMAAIRAEQAAVGLPDEIKADFRGEAAEADKSRTRQTLLFIAAVLTVYIVLGMLYESYAHPFTILTTLPSATFGSLLALVLMKVEFTLVTSIGCILVIGIVMKNAIIMVDFALAAERQEGLSSHDAIRFAAQLRVRPIVMTTLVALFSAVPLALGLGIGHELRQPLGIAIVGGLLVSQLMTLYSTPVVYVLIDRLRMRQRRSADAILAPKAAS